MIRRRLLTPSKQDREIGIVASFGKGFGYIFLCLFFVDIDVEYRADDWMLPPEEEIIGGQKYKIYSRNPKYSGENYFVFMFPK